MGHSPGSVGHVHPDQIQAVTAWVDGPRNAPLVIDARITSFPSWVLAHTFDGE